jgi:hypothetical protein
LDDDQISLKYTLKPVFLKRGPIGWKSVVALGIQMVRINFQREFMDATLSRIFEAVEQGLDRYLDAINQSAPF